MSRFSSVPPQLFDKPRQSSRTLLAPVGSRPSLLDQIASGCGKRYPACVIHILAERLIADFRINASGSRHMLRANRSCEQFHRVIDVARHLPLPSGSEVVKLMAKGESVGWPRANKTSSFVIRR